MNQIQMLLKQTESTYEWVSKLLHSIPEDQWEKIPPMLETSVSWQLGHLCLSIYYHSIWVISGHQPDLLEQFPLRKFGELFNGELFNGATAEQALGKISPEELQKHLVLVTQKSLDIIRGLKPEELEKPLELTPMPHPVAKTKFEAIDWNIKHCMWHCGQLGMLKRIVHERYDFGLRKAATK